jgi:hypothetical protein
MPSYNSLHGCQTDPTPGKFLGGVDATLPNAV